MTVLTDSHDSIRTVGNLQTFRNKAVSMGKLPPSLCPPVPASPPLSLCLSISLCHFYPSLHPQIHFIPGCNKQQLVFLKHCVCVCVCESVCVCVSRAQSLASH